MKKMKTKLFLMLLLSISFYGTCDHSGKVENKYAAAFKKVGIEDYRQYRYVFFFTEGCAGCRGRFLNTIMEDKWYQHSAVIVSKSNLQFLDGFRNKNIFIDSTNYLATHHVDFMTDGFIQAINDKPVITHINFNNSDSLLNYFEMVFK